MPTDDGRETVKLDTRIRDELRRYKADHGLTYSEAVEQLLKEVNWSFKDNADR